MPGHFEIGMTYKKNGRYFIAASEDLLVTWRSGKFHEIRGRRGYQPDRDISVKHLCKIWKIEMSVLDELTPRYFTPDSCRAANPSYRTAQRRNQGRDPSIRIVRLAS